MNWKMYLILGALLPLFGSINAQDIIAEDTYEVIVSNCNDNGMICIPILLEELNDFEILQNGQPYANAISSCDFDTLFNYNYNTLFGQGNAGPYMLNQWMVGDSPHSGSFQNMEELVALMNIWDADGDWSLVEDELYILGGSAGVDYGQMNVTVMASGMPSVIGYNLNIISNGIQLQFEPGQHVIVVDNTATGQSDFFTVKVDCQPNVEEVVLNMQSGESEEVCLDFSELVSNPNTVSNMCATLSGESAIYALINGGDCVTIDALVPGIDTACIIACDNMMNCDTTRIIAQVEWTATSLTFQDTIPANQEVFQVCLDTTELAGSVVSIENVCPDESGEFVNFNIDEDTYCVKYKGLECEGMEEACIVICDDLGLCDTTYLQIWTDETVCDAMPEVVEATILVNQEETFCLDTFELAGNIVEVENVCPDLSGENVDFDIDPETYCVTYFGLEAGKDTACVVLTDDLGQTDTTYFYVCVVTPMPEFIFDTIFAGDTETYCPNNDELLGIPTTIENICEDLSGENVTFTLNDVSLCLDATGITLGTDTACIVICDQFNICDTTYYYITVIEEDDGGNGNEDLPPPIAVDDDRSTQENSPIVIDVLGNDTIPAGSMVVVYLLPIAEGGMGPNNGTADVNADGTITYIPEQDFCGTDMFKYVLCNQTGCDTALVTVMIECEMVENPEIEIFNGFSPNDDGTNDTFTVEGIESFPDSPLTVYNRWGTVVHSDPSYRNAWDGTWNGQLLPDGTYFYLLEVDGTQYSGWVQLRR